MQKLFKIRGQELSGRPPHVQCLPVRGVAGSNIQRTSGKRIFRYLHQYRLIKTLPVNGLIRTSTCNVSPGLTCFLSTLMASIYAVLRASNTLIFKIDPVHTYFLKLVVQDHGKWLDYMVERKPRRIEFIKNVFNHKGFFVTIDRALKVLCLPIFPP